MSVQERVRGSQLFLTFNFERRSCKQVLVKLPIMVQHFLSQAVGKA